MVNSLTNYVLLCLAIIISCFGRSQQIYEAEIDSISKVIDIHDLTPLEKAKSYDRLGMLYYYRQDYPKAIFNRKKSEKIYSEEGSLKNQVKSLEFIGVMYSQISNHEKALSFFIKALRVAEDLSDEAVNNSLYLNIGTTYIEAEDFKNGIRYIKRTLPFYKKLQNKNLAVGYINIGIGYAGLALPDSALWYYETALNIVKTKKYDDCLSGSLINLGDLQLSNNRYDTAYDYYIEALNYFEKSNDTRGVWHSKFGIASVLKSKKKYAESKEILLNAVSYFNKINDFSYLLSCYELLSEIEYELNDLKSAIRFKNIYSELKDSVFSQQTTESLTNLQMSYEIDKLERENKSDLQIIEQESKINSLWWAVFSSTLIIIVVITMLFYHRNMSQKKIVEVRLHNSQLEKTLLENELNYSNNELENFALQIVQKNEFISSVKKDLKKIKNASNSDSHDQLNLLSVKINQSLKHNEDLDLFTERVDKVNNMFFANLTKIYPNLTKNEQRLCALLKLNLTSKEMALLTNVSEGAITMARYRLRKKLNLNKEVRLNDFFNNLI